MLVDDGDAKGGTSVVASAWWTTAGPAKRAPAASVDRS